MAGLEAGVAPAQLDLAAPLVLPVIHQQKVRVVRIEPGRVTRVFPPLDVHDHLLPALIGVQVLRAEAEAGGVARLGQSHRGVELLAVGHLLEGRDPDARRLRRPRRAHCLAR